MKILLIPPTHEQSNPSVHVPAAEAKRFVDYLRGRGIPLARGSDALEPIAGRDIVEIEIEAGETPLAEIETAIESFKQSEGAKES